MSESEPGAVAGQPSDQGPDLEYDLAHEDVEAPARPSDGEHVYVPTETGDYEGDYAYDLAHEVPRP